jgi:hypothetical protein
MAATATDPNDFSTMRTPKDVIQKITVLATLDNKGISEFCDTDLREWIEQRFSERMKHEAKAKRRKDPAFANDMGGES